jgi:antitoxin FitA
MSKMIQVRNVPDRLHRELVKRAKARGQSLTDYVEDVLEREVARPSREEVFERIRRLPTVDLGKPVADIIREERAANDEALFRGMSKPRT